MPWLLLLTAFLALPRPGPLYFRAIRRGLCWVVEDRVPLACPEEDLFGAVSDNLDPRPGGYNLPRPGGWRPRAPEDQCWVDPPWDAPLPLLEPPLGARAPLPEGPWHAPLAPRSKLVCRIVDVVLQNLLISLIFINASTHVITVHCIAPASL